MDHWFDAAHRALLQASSRREAGGITCSAIVGLLLNGHHDRVLGKNKKKRRRNNKKKSKKKRPKDPCDVDFQTDADREYCRFIRQQCPLSEFPREFCIIQGDGDLGLVAECCEPTQACCGRECVHLPSNNDHCGACGVVCTAGEACQHGNCVSACGPGSTICRGILEGCCRQGLVCCPGNGCFPEGSDDDPCTGCGPLATPCAGDSSCCPDHADWACCADGCKYIAGDDDNCGGCGMPCPRGQHCGAGGQCTCGDGFQYCEEGEFCTEEDYFCCGSTSCFSPDVCCTAQNGLKYCSTTGPCLN